MARLLRRSALRLVLRRRLWNGNRERLRDVLSADPARSVLAGGWHGHADYEKEYRASLGATDLAHVRFHLITDQVGYSAMIEAVSSVTDGREGDQDPDRPFSRASSTSR